MDDFVFGFFDLGNEGSFDLGFFELTDFFTFSFFNVTTLFASTSSDGVIVSVLIRSKFILDASLLAL